MRIGVSHSELCVTAGLKVQPQAFQQSSEAFMLNECQDWATHYVLPQMLCWQV